MKKATLDISPELLVDLFSGEGYARTYTVKKNALPNDARIIYCAWIDETGTGGHVRLLVESETFVDVPDGVEPPKLLPALSTITGAIDDAYERAAREIEELAREYDGQTLAVLDCAALAVRNLKGSS